MKVKACLVGLSMVLLPGQADAWFSFFQILQMVVRTFTPPVPVPAPKPVPIVVVTAAPVVTPKPKQTKTVVMRSNILPTWRELAPEGAVKIKLARVKDFWGELESSDMTTYGRIFDTAAENTAALDKIKTYYNEALKCLLATSIQDPNTPEEFKAKMEFVAACVTKARIPSFVVDASSAVTPAAPSYVPGNHLDPDDYPAKPTKTPTMAPTEPPTMAPTVITREPATYNVEKSIASDPGMYMPIEYVPDFTIKPPTYKAEKPITSSPATHMPIEDTMVFTREPATYNVEKSISSDPATYMPIDHPVVIPSLPETYAPPPVVVSVPQIEQPATTYNGADFQPKLRSAPDFRAIDANRDGLMTSFEWFEYVKKLNTLALEAASRANDKMGQKFLTAVIAYHYKNLAHCISSVTGKANDVLLSATQFAELMPSIDTQCDIKLRYSLQAGPPPFEWIAQKKNALSPLLVSEWFAKQLEEAKKGSKPLAQEQVNFVSCVKRNLKEKPTSMINRKTFYDIMTTCS